MDQETNEDMFFFFEKSKKFRKVKIFNKRKATAAKNVESCEGSKTFFHANLLIIFDWCILIFMLILSTLAHSICCTA